MKSRYIASKTESEKIAIRIAREEVERQKAIVCPACEQNIGNHSCTDFTQCLHDEYGFGKQRLKNVIECTEGLFLLCAVDGKRFNAVQAVEWLRDAMGIDLNKGE